MRTTLTRLAVALATFGLGVTLATLWLGLFATSDAPSHKRESCRFRERIALAPAPAVAPLPPAPPLGPVVAAPRAVETLKAETCEGTADGRTITGGVLNGKAISKPAPKYPIAAREAHASGTVVVRITVDECGDVERAEAVSGPALLREAALDAAYESRFSPTRLDGDPVKVSGTITYNFEIH